MVKKKYSFSFYKYFSMGKNFYKVENVYIYKSKKECTNAMSLIIYTMKILGVRYGMTPMIENDPTLELKTKDPNVKVIDFTK